MHLAELFDSPAELDPVTPREARTKYGLHDVQWAFRFEARDETYVVYCDACSGSTSDLTLGFGSIDDQGKFNHRVTNRNIPFEIMGRVLQAFRAGIREHNPVTMSFRGNSEKQTRLYAKLILRLASEIPDYKAYVYPPRGRLYLSKDLTFGDKPWAVPFEDFLRKNGFNLG